MIKAILFDLDGTLIDTVELIIETFQHTARTVLQRELSREEIVPTFGLTLAEAFAGFTDDAAMAERMREAYREYNEIHHDRLISRIDGVEDVLGKIAQAGYKQAVVTSKKRLMAQRGLRCCGLEAYIETIVACGETVMAKPHPEPMLKACRLLGVAPEECLCIGDSPFDLQSGKSAGTLTAAVRYTAYDWQRLLQEGQPDFIINEPSDILDILEGLRKGRSI
ncbi:MAG: pyrophosphatase PpaX [Acidaminococcaceae bacterium]|nr:pyrophosphatase PpaX [Acidaminococcaceae bacterium]